MIVVCDCMASFQCYLWFDYGAQSTLVDKRIV